MLEFLHKLFVSDFMPHGYCYLWKPGIVWLHVASDATITLAYYLIPIALFYFVRKRRDLPFNWMFVMFAVFILGCGTTHLMEVWTLWHGTYRLAGVIKALTAAASVATAFLFIPLIPKALALPRPQQLRDANRELENEIEERRHIQLELKSAHDELERRVQERTVELGTANELLRAEIAERVRAEQSLKKQAGLLELAHDAIIVRGMTDEILYWNSGAEESYGWGRDEALGKQAPALLGSVYPADSENPKEVAIRMGHWEGEVSQVRRDGTSIVMASRWALQRDETGGPSAILQINRDITSQKRAAEALRESEARWRAVFESSATGIALVDRDGIFAAANPAYQKMLDHTLDELLGRLSTDVTYPEDREATRRAISELLAGERTYVEMEKRYMRKGGVCMWARVRVSPIHGEDGVPHFLLTIAEDITERKHADEEMRKLAALVENSTDFIGIASNDDKALFLNATGRRLVGLSDHEPLEVLPILEFIAKEDRARFENETLPSVLRDGWWQGETIFRNFHTGESIPMWQHIFFITEQGSGKRLAMATVSRDLTERKRAEQNNQEAQTELAHMARLSTMGELAASIAHEVNQPLAAVVANANACVRWMGAAPPNLEEARAALNRIVREGNRAAGVIGGIRSMLKKSAPQMRVLDMNDLVSEVLMLTNHELRRNSVTLRTELASDIPPVRGDSVQLRQAILNLIMNAIEATGAAAEGSRDLLVSSHRQQPDSIVVAVRDSGVGIDPANLDRIFQPFFTTKSSGMGMGLAITKSAIEAHGGRLWATPNFGPGVTFQFSVPAASAA
jgi:PAS domain S-box-containing protein